MANRDEILRELIVEEIRCAVENGAINIKDLLRYDQDFVFSDPRDIPSLGYVESLIGTGGSVIVYRTFIISASDITDGSVNLTGRTNEQGDTAIPSNANQTIYELGLNGKPDVWVKSNAQFDEDNEVSGLDGSLDVKVVLIGSEVIDDPFYDIFIKNIDSNGSNVPANDLVMEQPPLGDISNYTGFQGSFPKDIPIILKNNSVNTYYLYDNSLKTNVVFTINSGGELNIFYEQLPVNNETGDERYSIIASI